ncbi:hypothetical protein VPH35_140219 [Triticum aestivum]
MRRGFDGKAPATGGCGADRLGALPDEILQHALSFLPSREAVRTCLLSRRWRHQWKSAPALRVADVDAFKSAQRFNEFVNHLIVLRDRTPLHACEIAAYKEYKGRYYDDEEPSRYTDLWIRYAMSCNVRLLRLSNHDPSDLDAQYENIEDVLLHAHIASHHLTTLELEGVMFSCEYPLDLSSCPNLETIKMNRCSSLIHVNIWSRSVRCLCITEYDFYSYDEEKPRAAVYVPSLVYLELNGGRGLVPAFESMPLLQTASIKFDWTSTREDNNDGFLLLGRLSDATNLELISEPQALSFRKDLMRCTAFSKLKTLSLNDWCVEPDFGPLLHFLQRSPSLEKLCLRLSKPDEHAKETNASYVSTEPFLASKHLRVVKIRCQANDERVPKILKVMSSYGVPAEQIDVKEGNWSSEGSYSDSEQSDYSYSDTDESD